MIDIEGIKARLDIAESGIKCAEQAIENAKACFDKAKEMLDAKDAKPPRNWPERIEAGMQVADCMICGIHPYSFRSGEWARLAGVAMVTPKDAEPRLAYVAIFDDGVVDYIAVSDGMNISIKARDILTIRTDAHEPTGAELVGVLENIRNVSNNPGRTLTTLGLTECLQSCNVMARNALDGLAK